jgi:sugar phosphate isomerase/epimerase
MLKGVNSTSLAIFFDLQNYFLIRGYNTQEMIQALASDICEIHAKDGRGHMSGALLGTEDAGFYKSVEVLKRINYSGWIHLENYYDQYPLSSTGEDPFKLIRKDLQILRDAFSV